MLNDRKVLIALLMISILSLILNFYQWNQNRVLNSKSQKALNYTKTNVISGFRNLRQGIEKSDKIAVIQSSLILETEISTYATLTQERDWYPNTLALRNLASYYINNKVPAPKKRDELIAVVKDLEKSFVGKNPTLFMKTYNYDLERIVSELHS